jgi:Holliday junction DNA helicase RuvB
MKKGLEEMHRRMLYAIVDKFEGGPVGLNTIAEVYEPYLLQTGFL